MQLTMQFMLLSVLVSAILRDVIAVASSCIVPELMGEMFQEKERHSIDEFHVPLSPLFNRQYIKFQAGTPISDSTFMELICHEGYFAKDIFQISASVQCIMGQWVPDPQCVRDMADDIFTSQISTSKETHSSEEKKSINSNKCTIPPVKNGEVGIFKATAEFLYERLHNFITLNEGDVINHGEKVYLICDDAFTPYQDMFTRKVASVCNNGTWTRSMECFPTSCLDDPPPAKNGHSPKSLAGRQHGELFPYQCQSGYEQVTKSTVICEFGTWKGEPPKCEELKKDPCLKDPPTAPHSDPVIGSRNHGDYVFYKCHDGWLPEESGWFVCDYGEWMGKLPKCMPAEVYRQFHKNDKNMEDFTAKPRHQTRSNLGVASYPPAVIFPEDYDLSIEVDPESNIQDKDAYEIKTSQKKPMKNSPCSGKPPIIENADPRVENSSHGSLMWYKCHKGYKKVKRGNVTCTDGVWKGPKPVCVLESETSCLADPPDVANAEAIIYSTAHGSTIWYKCRKGFIKSFAGEIYCDSGFWKGKLPECLQTERYGSKQLQAQMRHSVKILPPVE